MTAPVTGSLFYMFPKDEEGSTHLFECTERGQDGKICVVWIPKWLPKRIPRDFTNRPFVWRFCAATEDAELRTTAATPKDSAISTKLTSPFNVDSNNQHDRWDNVRIFGVYEEADEDVCQKLFDVTARLVLRCRGTASAFVTGCSVKQWVIGKDVSILSSLSAGLHR